MTNIGNVDLLVHTVEDNRLGLITGGPIVQTVQPGETFSVTATVIVAEPVINTVTWTSETDGGPPAAGTASATVLIGNPYWLYLPVIFGPASIGASE
jgi:hypothetical protein